MDLFSIIVEVIRVCWGWIYFLSPLKVLIVKRGQLGVRFTCGRPGPNLKPGVHLATTLQTMEADQAIYCKNDCDEVCTFTEDLVPVRVNGVVVYSIINMGKYTTASQDTHWLIGELGEASIESEVNSINFESFHSQRSAIQKDIARATQEAANKSGFGIRVHYVRITGVRVCNRTIQAALALPLIFRTLAEAHAVIDDGEYELDPLTVALLCGASPVNRIDFGQDADEG